ncbi:DEAD/DEAH box helicase [Pelomyxa schiedti]|nr:DEAD/DEAH box helicase [Pelomyxa schiedti]
MSGRGRARGRGSYSSPKRSSYPRRPIPQPPRRVVLRQRSRSRSRSRSPAERDAPSEEKPADGKESSSAALETKLEGCQGSDVRCIVLIEIPEQPSDPHLQPIVPQLLFSPLPDAVFVCVIVPRNRKFNFQPICDECKRTIKGELTSSDKGNRILIRFRESSRTEIRKKVVTALTSKVSASQLLFYCGTNSKAAKTALPTGKEFHVIPFSKIAGKTVEESPSEKAASEPPKEAGEKKEPENNAETKEETDDSSKEGKEGEEEEEATEESSVLDSQLFLAYINDILKQENETTNLSFPPFPPPLPALDQACSRAQDFIRRNLPTGKLPKTKEQLASAIKGMCEIQLPFNAEPVLKEVIRRGWVFPCPTCRQVCFSYNKEKEDRKRNAMALQHRVDGSVEIPQVVLDWLSNHNLHMCVTKWQHVANQLTALRKKVRVDSNEVVKILENSNLISDPPPEPVVEDAPKTSKFGASAKPKTTRGSPSDTPDLPANTESKSTETENPDNLLWNVPSGHLPVPDDSWQPIPRPQIQRPRWEPQRQMSGRVPRPPPPFASDFPPVGPLVTPTDPSRFALRARRFGISPMDMPLPPPPALDEPFPPPPALPFNIPPSLISAYGIREPPSLHPPIPVDPPSFLRRPRLQVPPYLRQPMQAIPGMPPSIRPQMPPPFRMRRPRVPIGHPSLEVLPSFVQPRDRLQYNPESLLDIPMEAPVEETKAETEASLKSSFADFGLRGKLVRALSLQGFDKPSQTQQIISKMIDGWPEYCPPVIQGPGGSGKTLAYLVPILHKLSPKKNLCQALIITPTRELASQVHDVASKIAANLSEVKVVLLTGGDSVPRKVILRTLLRFTKIQLISGHVVVGTPGRVKHMLNNRLLFLSFQAAVVYDEFDLMIQDYKFNELRRLLEDLSKGPVIFVGTTVSNAKNYVFEPSTVPTKDLIPESIEHKVVLCPNEEEMPTSLLHFLHSNSSRFSSCIIFCSVKNADFLPEKIKQDAGFSYAALHGSMAQTSRRTALEEFRSGKAVLLLCTDDAARGLDIPTVGLVVNYGVAPTRTHYIHRACRTGRFGRPGLCATLCVGDVLPTLAQVTFGLRRGLPSDPPAALAAARASQEAMLAEIPKRIEEAKARVKNSFKKPTTDELDKELDQWAVHKESASDSKLEPSVKAKKPSPAPKKVDEDPDNADLFGEDEPEAELVQGTPGEKEDPLAGFDLFDDDDEDDHKPKEPREEKPKIPEPDSEDESSNLGLFDEEIDSKPTKGKKPEPKPAPVSHDIEEETETFDFGLFD